MSDRPPVRRGGGRPPTVESMVLARELRRVDPNVAFQKQLMVRAGESIVAAELVLDRAPTSAFISSYDGMRLCVDAHLNSHGLRAESGDGAHRHRIAYAEAEMKDIVGEEHLAVYRAARAQRNAAEYPEPGSGQVNKMTAARAIAVAKQFHGAMRNYLRL